MVDRAKPLRKISAQIVKIAARVRHGILGPRDDAVFFTRDKYAYADYKIGEWTYGSPAVLDFGDGGTLTIGRFCSIAEGVSILLGGEHRHDWVTTYPFNVVCKEARCFKGHPRSKGPVVIGNDVWIGNGATILSGVKIGDGAVIAAGSVVAATVPAYSIVAGNPARFVKHRFSQQHISALLEIRWWNWPIERIREAWPLLLSGDVGMFVARYGAREPANRVGALSALDGNGLDPHEQSRKSH